ncbi:PBP1b-binding outer membrane lipoprotein LpoB [Bradyrhizobium ottawaense]
MKLLAAAAVVLLLGGCATMQQPNPAPKVVKAAKPACPCEKPTPNEAVKKRWFSGFKVRLFH